MKKKLEMAPSECPKCGERKGWAYVKDPSVYNPTRSDNIIDGLEAGLLGMLIGAILPVTRKLECHCWNCDFRNTYIQK